jgi:pheromone shutdown protein TraB
MPAYNFLTEQEISHLEETIFTSPVFSAAARKVAESLLVEVRRLQSEIAELRDADGAPESDNTGVNVSIGGNNFGVVAKGNLTLSDQKVHTSLHAEVRRLKAETLRLKDELAEERVMSAEADDYARKLMELLKKHFPGIDPGLLKEADAQIGETLSKLRAGDNHARV